MSLLKKILSFGLSALLLLLLIAPAVYAQEASSSAQSDTQTSDVSVTPTSSPQPSEEPTPTATPTPEPTSTPTPTPQPSDTPTPTPTAQPTQSPSPTPTPTDTPPSIQLNQTYASPSNSKVTVKFTSLPDSPGSISFNEIQLSDVQKQLIGALSNTAYDISSSMSDGTFIYDLTLPIPDGATLQNLRIKFTHSLSDGSFEDVTGDITVNSDNTITIHGINHFTIFVVVNPNDQTSCDGVTIGTTPGTTCFATVQEAVNAASNGDTINVGAGTYSETVTVNKSLTFNGSGSPTIDTMIITASPVNINGITVNNLIYPDTQAPVISGVTLSNLTTGNNTYVKNGDSVRLTAVISDNNQSTITISMIKANLSSLGGGSAVNPSSYDPVTGIATWDPITVSGTGNGLVTVMVDASDAAGNTATQQTRTIIADNLGPGQATNLSITNPINNGNKTSISISGRGEVGAAVSYTISNGASNISGTTTVDNSGSFSVTGIDVSSLGDGTLTLSITLTDTAGNTSSPATTTATKDTEAPTVSAGSNQVKNAQFSQIGTVSDPTPSSGIASYLWSQVSGPGTITFGSANLLTTTISADQDGIYVIQLTVTDNAGNSANSTFTLIWDTTNPLVDAGLSQIKNSSFTQTGTASDSLSGVASVLWIQVSGPGTITFGSANALSTTISANQDGTYIIQLTATDNAGNTQTSQFTLLWDTVSPNVDVSPDIVTNSQFTKIPTVTDPAPGSGIASYLWSQVSGPGTITFGSSIALSTTISADADGVYVIQLTATDNAGNSSSSTFSLTWDTTSPTVSAGSDQVKNAQFSQTGTASDTLSGVATTIWSQVSGPGIIIFGSANNLSTTVSADIDGTYVIRLIVTDNAGNSVSSTFTLTWDTVQPNVSAGSNVTTNAQFTQVGTITDPAPSSGIAGVAWSQISGPGIIAFGSANAASTTISANQDGTYVIQLTVTDNAGNISSSTFTLVWDTVPANVNVGANVTTNTSFSKTATVNDPVPSSGVASTIWTQVSGPGTIIFGTPNSVATTISADLDGTYVVRLTVLDNAGNSSSSQFTLVWDTTNPSVNAGSNVTTNTGFTQNGTAADSLSGVASTTWSQVSGPGVITFGTPNALSTTVSASLDGTYVIQLTVQDVAGNTNSSTFTLVWDTTQPTVSAGGNITTNAQFSQTGTASDILSGVVSTLWTQVSGPGTITFGSANALTTTISADVDGVYVIRLTATDAAGNSANSTFTLTWDTTNPNVSAGSNVTTNAQFTQVGTANDTTSGVASTTWSQVSGPGTITFGSANALSTTISADTDGVYVIRLTVIDNAGNSSSSTFTLTWDTTNPNTSAGSNQTKNAQFTQTGTASDLLSGVATTVWSQVSGPGTITFGSANSLTTTISANVDGTYVIRLTVTDNAGNSASSTFILTWDTQNPTGSWVNPTSGQTVYGVASLKVNVADSFSGVASITFQYQRNDGVDSFHNLSTFFSPNPSISTTWDTSGLALDFYTLRLIVVDLAGNSLNLDQIVGIGTVITPPGSQPAQPSKSSMTITWITANPATSRVVFDTVSHSNLGAAPNYGYANSSEESDLAKVSSHSVILNGLTPGTTYYYRMISKGSPESVSEEFSFATQAAAVSSGGGGGGTGGGGGGIACNDGKPESTPTLLSAIANGFNQIILTWSKAKGPVSYYLLTYGLSSGKQQFGNPNVGGQDTTTYTVSGLQSGVTYYFRVRAGNGCTPGEFSNELSARAKGQTFITTAYAAEFEPGVLGESLEASLSATPSVFLTPEPEVMQIITPVPQKADKKPALSLVIALIIGSVLFFLSRI